MTPQIRSCSQVKNLYSVLVSEFVFNIPPTAKVIQGQGLDSHPTDWRSRVSNSGILGTRGVVEPLYYGLMAAPVQRSVLRGLWYLDYSCSVVAVTWHHSFSVCCPHLDLLGTHCLAEERNKIRGMIDKF